MKVEGSTLLTPAVLWVLTLQAFFAIAALCTNWSAQEDIVSKQEGRTPYSMENEHTTALPQCKKSLFPSITKIKVRGE